MMEILLSTGSLTPRGIADAANIARQAGADGLELLLTGNVLSVGPAAAIHAAAQQQVPIRSIHPPIRFVRAREHVYHDMLAAAEFACAIPGCRTLVMHAVGGPGLHTERGRAFFRTIGEVAERLKKSGVRLAIENRGTVQPRPRPDFLDRLQNLYRVCEEWDLDITFDTSHAASFGLNIVSALDVIYPRLANIHLSDRREEPPAIASGILNSLTRDHQLPGNGTLPLGMFLQRLRAKGYVGAVTLELSPVALASWRSKSALERTWSAVSFAREHTAAVRPTQDEAHGARRTHAPLENDI
ncbi:MAG: sugar phosphate isomerase/epimerase [Thermomicrobia bacterium]|nr:sugar phosphate isomerase/epimerase [Thermomicrobia bacterium]